MVIRVTCPRCKRVVDHLPLKLGQKHGFGRDPRWLPFRCLTCAPKGIVTVLEPDPPKAPRPTLPGPGTLAEMIAEGAGIGFYCYDGQCGYKVDLDLPALAERLGAKHKVSHDALIPVLTPCPKCGGRRGSGAGIRHHPNYDRLMRKGG